jgi:hypothetical protein
MPSKIRDIADILGVTEAANPTNAVLTSVADGSGLVVYATLDDLPTSGLTAGDQAYITSTNRLYVSNGSGWYNVALFNATPTLSISPSGAVSLAVDGSTPTVITLTGTDSDYPDANLTYTVESDGSFSNIATISQDSSVFTITPLSEDSATPGSSTLTFKVSDGISFGSGTTQFSLTFGPDWSATPTESILRASDAEAADQFGYSVSISSDGTYAIAGAWRADTIRGSAYIFTRSGSTWTQQAKIVASDRAINDEFGFSVAINSDGSYAIIGAVSKNTDEGAAYIFTRSGSTWTQQAKILASDTTTDIDFGSSVAINPDATYAVVGALGADGSNTGAVYVFTRSGSTWTQQQKISNPNATNFDNFGKRVSINSDGSYIIASNQFEDTEGSAAGGAYVFTRSGSTWTQQSRIISTDIQAADQFGADVEINSDATYAIVGAVSEDGGAGDPISNCGSAYIFTRSGSTWTQQARLQASDAQINDQLGTSVSINSDATYAIVSTVGEDGGVGDPIATAGAAYIFERSGSTWTQVRKLTASDAQASDQFGGSVSISSDGTYAIVGARIEDGGAGDPIADAGAAYIYEAG